MLHTKKYIIAFLVVGSFVLLTTSFIGAAYDTQNQGKACFQKTCFDVEVVSTPQTREYGLMFRKELAKNHGMLFIFEQEGKYPFWMKNTLIPLDIVWIDKNKKVVFIKKNAQPCLQGECPLVTVDREALYVLEVNAGMADEIKVSVGNDMQLLGIPEGRKQ